MTTARQGGRRPVGGDPAGAGSAEGGGPGGGSLSYARALALVVVAVVLGAYLLGLGNGGAPPQAGAPLATTTTTPPASTTTTTTAVAPSQAVKVLVANASATNGMAGFYTTKLSGAGWGTLTPTNASTTEATSSVYYAAGQQPAANAVAAAIGVPAAAVQPLGTAVPVQGTTGASVVVVVGNDLAAKATPATSTAG